MTRVERKQTSKKSAVGGLSKVQKKRHRNTDKRKDKPPPGGKDH